MNPIRKGYDKRPRSQQKRVTLKDISRASGLAISTVSNALTGRDSVREETRQRLLQVADELGYRTSSLARSLRTGKTGSIGMLVTDITSPFYSEVIRGAEDFLLEQGYLLLIGNSDHDAEKEANYINHFFERQVEGVILVPYSFYSKNVPLIHSAGLPLCLFNRRHENLILDLVGTDFQTATQITLEYLWELGHRNIAFIMGKADSSVAIDRLAAVQFFLREKSAPQDSVTIRQTRYTLEAGEEIALELMTRHPKLTAIMTGQDTLAIGVIIALQKLGLRVPEDVSVVGFDDTFPSALPQINLTTLRVPRRRLGRMAAETVLERIAAPGEYVKTLHILPELVIRGTTGPVRNSA